MYIHTYAYLMSIAYMLCSYVMHMCLPVCEWASKIWNKNASDFHKIWKEAAEYLWFSSELIGLNGKWCPWKGNCLIPNALKIWAHIAFTDVCGFLLFPVPTAQRNSIEFYICSVFELKIAFITNYLNFVYSLSSVKCVATRLLCARRQKFPFLCTITLNKTFTQTIIVRCSIPNRWDSFI